MKKLWIIFFAVYVLSGCSSTTEMHQFYCPVDIPSFEMSYIKTDNSEFTVGEKVWEEKCGATNGSCYTIFLGIGTNNNILIQDFYPSGFKYNDPYMVTSIEHMTLPIGDRKPQGTYTFWYDNGPKGVTKSYIDGVQNGTWTYWHFNGQKEKEFCLINALRVGYEASWYTNGQIKSEGYNSSNGHTDGAWTYWNEDGGKSFIKTFEEGVPTDIVFLD